MPKSRDPARHLALLQRGLPEELQLRGPADEDFALAFLQHYGYTDPLCSEDELIAGTKQYQRLVGLKVDGRVGQRTLRRMQVPRCGFPDVYRPDRHQQFLAVREFVKVRKAKWRKTALRYTVEAYVGRVPQATQEQIFADAFRAWGHPHSSITAIQVKASEPHDIVISTGSSRQDQFDGPGGTLAWAYLPDGRDGKLLMKFDLAETWITDATAQGILLFNVACHELGHILGLEHSRVKAALMAPYYNARIAVPQANDDIPRIGTLYPPTAAPPPSPPTGHTLHTIVARSGPTSRRNALDFSIYVQAGDDFLVSVDGKKVA